MARLKEDLTVKFSRSSHTFESAAIEDEDREYLRLFSFICELSFDVYLKTQLIEMLADQLREDSSN